MKFENYIHELLKENETVIIPGFGAFITSYKPAKIVKNEIIPPTTEIVFNPQIRNNDGLLVGFIAENEKISHFDALRLIEKERENIIYLLDKGEEVNLEGTGILYSSEHKEIQFRPVHDENLFLDSFGLESVSLPEADESKIEEVADVMAADEPEHAVDNESSDDDEKKEEIPMESDSAEEKPGEKPEPAVKEISEETIDEQRGTDADVISENSENISQEERPSEENTSVEIQPEELEPEFNEVSVEEEITDGKVTEPENPEPAPEQEKESVFVPLNAPEEKKKRSGWWYLLILIPIIVAGLFILRNQKNEPDTEIAKGAVNPEQTNPEVRQNEAPIDSARNVMVEEHDTDSVNSAVPMEEKITSEVSDSLKFYLVGGGFKEEANAETYLNELKGKGLEPFHMGKRGNFYMIGIGKYRTEAEAVQARRAYADSHPGSGAWILEEK